MSILAQYNILGFYNSLTARNWNRQINNGANEEVFRVFLQTNKVPAIQLMVNSATTATIQVFDIDDNAIGSPLSMTVGTETGYKSLTYLGTTLTGNDDGDYYLKIINGANTYYSDVFGWTSNSTYLSELLKISAVSADIRLGKTYVAGLTSFAFECYLNAEYLGITPEVSEDLAQQNGANIINYADLIPTHEFNIDANEYIQRFLLGLRILECNGTVTITWAGKSYTANDIMAEKADEIANEMAFMVKLSFVDHSEIISVNNENS